MNSAKRCASFSKTINLFSWNKTQAQDWIVASASAQIPAIVSGCHYCHLSRTQRPGITLNPRLKKKLSFQPLVPPTHLCAFVSVAKEPQSISVSENACPQGIQGDGTGDSTFNLWLDNCRRYGLENCDQQLQGIQTGRKTMAEVMADQDKLIADIAAEYRRRNLERRRQVEFQGVQHDLDLTRLPDINLPCPQGVQGEDCARFKMWLENCHKFQFGNCQDQLDNYNSGRITLSQLFEEQDKMIRDAAQAVSSRVQGENMTQGSGGASSGSSNETQTVASSSKPLTSAQKLRNAVAVYGSTVMVFHVSISLMSLGFFYTLVSSGIDVVGLLGRLGIGETILKSKLATGTGTFVVAYAVHKVFAPARIAVTLTSTPLIVRYLRRVGFLKTPPPPSSSPSSPPTK